MSRWIRRALISGGFGTGVRVPPQDATPVIPYSGIIEVTGSPIDDPEAIKQKPGTPPSLDGEDLLVSPDTPFFHVDVISAVRAAEQRVLSSSIPTR
jgi:solute carrier family 26 (sodium-independent sulfate anion transporter), member 11